MSMADAIADCKNDFLSGKTVNFAEIADDYGLNPALLERKFKESYPNGPAKLENGSDWFKNRLEEEIQHWCKHYNVSRERCNERTIRGERYTIIGRYRSRVLGVSHKDGKAYKISG